MAAGLDQDALARVDQDDRKLGVRSAGRHVARVLLVARRVGDDEFALVGGEEAIGDVDGDALLPLGLQPVDQKREVDVAAGGAVLLRILFQGREMILEQELGIVEQPADQRRLAVVDAAAGQEAQQRLLLLRSEELSEVGGGVHQKYPSFFFFSIDDFSSESISRPWRSEVRAVNISVTMPSSVSASESMAPVSG